MKKHNKHALLNRPNMGEWGRSEYAILGTTCDSIHSIVTELYQAISPSLKVAYIDASHTEDDYANEQLITYTSHEKHIEVRKQISQDKYNNRLVFNDSDIQLINGNHFDAAQQIVILDNKKKESLSKKTHKLTNVKYVISTEEQQEIWQFLKPFVTPDTQLFSFSELSTVANSLVSEFKNKIPLNGLVLAGGKSQRMGFDKSTIDYHGDSQVNHVSSLLSTYCENVFVSLRSDQQDDFKIERINDSFSGFGPMGGILSAFQKDTNAAWLTIATDLPFVNDHAIKQLIDQRDRTKIATCFIRSDQEFPDPLFTIWEPKAYQHLLSYLSIGYSCPRKVLINSDVKVIPIEDDKVLTNVNNQEQLEAAKQLLNK